MSKPKTTEPPFLQKVKKAYVIEFADIERVKEYKNQLVNVLLYEPPMAKKRGGDGERSCYVHGRSIAGIYAEINGIERWLKMAVEKFILDNNRKEAL